MARLRMRDCIGSAVLEELYGIQYLEVAYTPHDFAYQRKRGLAGYSNPDDPRVLNILQYFNSFEIDYAYGYIQQKTKI